MLHINVQQQLGRLTLRADLQLPTQGVTAIFGLSGSGKTSLINLVSGLTHPDQGFIRLNDRTLVDEFSTIIKDLVEYDFSIAEEQMKVRLNIA